MTKLAGLALLGAMVGGCGSVVPSPAVPSPAVPSPSLTPSASPAVSSTPTPSPTAAASATASAAATVARATFDPSTLSGSIALAHEGDIWVMDADGSNRVRLTDDPEQDFDPAWSPDGSMIAFRAHRDGNEEVYVMNADGSEQTNLTQSDHSDYSPAWSPDGTHIAFATDRDPDSGGNDIYVAEVATGEVTRLTIGGEIDEYPTWSPDGTQIAYACSHGRLPEGTADFDVCVMNADGSEQSQLTDAEGLSDYPAWSPDGTQIAFMSTRGGWPTLPGYTPPGYEPGEFGEYDIYVMDADGGNVRNVTNNGRESEQFPGWSPDGRHVIFSRYACLIAAAADGSAEAELTIGAECADVFPDWRR